MSTPSAEDLARLSAERVAAFRQQYPILFFNPRPSQRPFFYDPPDVHTVQFLFGPKRGGKSEATAARIAIALAGMNPIFLPPGPDGRTPLDMLPKRPIAVRICVTSMERVGRKIILPKLLRWIPREMLDTRVGKEIRGFNKQANTLYLKDGSYAELVSYDVDPSQWASAEFDIIDYDEPPPEDVHVSQLARVVTKGGFIIGAMTLDARDCTHNIRWVDRRIRRYGDGDHVSWYQLKPGENVEFLQREHPDRAPQIKRAYDAWVGSLSDDERLAAVEGLPSWLGGLVWPDFDPHVHAAYSKLRPTDFAALVRHGFGEIHCALDHGVDHPTVCLWFFVAKRPLLDADIVEGDHIGLWEYWRRHAYPQEHAPAVAKINEHLGVRPRVIWADPSASLWGNDAKGGPSVAMFYTSKPWSLPLNNQTNNDHEYGYAAVAAMLKPRLNSPVLWPRLRFCKGMFPHTTEEILGLVYNPKWGEEKNKDKVIETHDDCPDCLRYMATALRWLRPGERFVPHTQPPTLDAILGVPYMPAPPGAGVTHVRPR